MIKPSQKCNILTLFENSSYPQTATQLPLMCLDDFEANRGKTNALDMIDSNSKPSGQRSVQDRDTEQSLMTPARRAALDALEREFHELLQTAAR